MSILKGIKVLDLTRVLAGPYCTMILGDLGAEVIKIERPILGDDSRNFGPFHKGESCYYKSINRNKKSLTLDLKQEEGKTILRELIKTCDVIVENFRPGTMEKLGVSYEEVSKINENIIYACISGYGHTGPYSKKPAYDAIVQAMGGIMSITGQEDKEPTRVGSSIGDINAGLYGTIGILAALYKRAITGKGDYVDIAMLDCQVSLLENAIARFSITGDVPKPMGNRHSSIVPFESFRTKDSTIMIAIGNDKLWNTFCEISDNDEIKSSIFSTNEMRNQNYSTLKEILCNMFLNETTDYWLSLLNQHDIPCSSINTIDKVVENEQIIAREMIITEKLDDGNELLMPSTPLKFKNETFDYHKAPTLGQDYFDILSSHLNLDSNTINNLLDKKVI